MKLVVLPVVQRPTFTTSLQEVSSLLRHISCGLQELDALDRKAAVMETELQAFLETYYSRILPLTARLERLRHRKAHGVFPNRSLRLDMQGYTSSISAITRKKKSLFRNLAKLCHPDNCSNDCPVDISEVLEARTVSKLWQLQIRQATWNMQEDALTACLETQRAEIGCLMLEGRMHARRISNSDEWKLKERVCDAALGGVDLIEHIQQRIEKQIAALQQYFVKPKVLHPEAA